MIGEILLVPLFLLLIGALPVNPVADQGSIFMAVKEWLLREEVDL